MTGTFEAVGIGRCTADHVGAVSHYPNENDKLRIVEFAQQGGGLTATAMVALSRLGVSTTFIARLGQDSISSFIIDSLRHEGVDTSYVSIDPGLKGPFAFVMVNQQTGSRTISYTWEEARRLDPDSLPRKVISSSKLLLVDDYEGPAAIEAARIAHHARVPSFLDADGVYDKLPLLVGEVDYPVLNAPLAMNLTGASSPAEAARKLYQDFLPRLAVVTAGEEGVFAFGSDGGIHQPAFEVEVRDTTGAGDVFHGAFGYGVLKGWEPAMTLRFAAAVAAVKCTKLGGRAGIPTVGEAQSFLIRQGTPIP